MTSIGMTAHGKAKTGGAVSGIENAETGTIQFRIRQRLKQICPTKTWGFLVDLFSRHPHIEMHERVAKHRMAGSRAFTVDEIAILLQSEEGFEILTEMMAGSRPSWWRICSPLMEVAEIERMRAAAKRRLQKVVRGAIDADRDIDVEVDAIETALALRPSRSDGSRPSVHRKMVGAYGASVGLPRGAMAAASGRTR